MKKKFAVYCSGGASRVIKFFNQNSKVNYRLEVIFYDGNDVNIINQLKKISENVFVYTDFISNPEFKINKSNLLNNLLAKHNIDYVFCFGNSILKGDILQDYKNRIVNFHPSLLPAFPGLSAIDQALKSNVKILGNTAHFIDAGVDTGPIIMQTVVSRDNFKDYEDVLFLQIAMMKDIWHLLENDLIEIKDNVVVISKEPNKTYYKSL